jgi:hypothetical protein
MSRLQKFLEKKKGQPGVEDSVEMEDAGYHLMEEEIMEEETDDSDAKRTKPPQSSQAIPQEVKSKALESRAEEKKKVIGLVESSLFKEKKLTPSEHRIQRWASWGVDHCNGDLPDEKYKTDDVMFVYRGTDMTVRAR